MTRVARAPPSLRLRRLRVFAHVLERRFELRVAALKKAGARQFDFNAGLDAAVLYDEALRGARPAAESEPL